MATYRIKRFGLMDNYMAVQERKAARFGIVGQDFKNGNIMTGLKHSVSFSQDTMNQYMTGNYPGQKAFSVGRNIIESWQHIPYTLKHWYYVNKISWERQNKLYPLHDIDKVIMYTFCPFLGTDKISELHQKLAKHHIRNKKDPDYKQAIIDWESARFTKPDKPLNARQTCERFYPEYKEILEPYFKELGL